MPRRRAIALRVAASVILASIAVVSLGGCFAMRPVPPAPGLAAVARPDAHESSQFDDAASSEIASEWGSCGDFILVHPTINGRDVGWFILDTGASGSTISARAAAAAGLPAIGKTVIAGPTAPASAPRSPPPIESTVFRADALALGPLTLHGLAMTGLDLEHATGTFGRPVAGILGQNVFASAIVELDGPARAVRLHAPHEDHALDGLVTVPIEMRRGLPYLRASFGDVRDALFLLDTGANVGVHVAAESVERLGLADGAGVAIDGGRERRTFGSSERVDAGTIESFRVGGVECGPLPATFGRPSGADRRRDAGVDGQIGMGLLVRHVVLIDVPRLRMAFAGADRAP